MTRFRAVAPLIVVVALMVGTGHAAAAPPADLRTGAGGSPHPGRPADATGAETVAGSPTVPAGSAYVAADDPDEARQLLDGLAAGRVAATTVTYGPCTLYPSPIRIRTDGKVGTKPQTRCTVPVTSIRHSTDMRYKSFIWWRHGGHTYYARVYPERGSLACGG